jgi:ferrous iron transport protein A
MEADLLAVSLDYAREETGGQAEYNTDGGYAEERTQTDASDECTLDTLGIGQKGIVTAVQSANAILRNKLLSMGIVKSTPFRVTNIAPLGDPMSITVRGFKLCLRRSEARSIRIRIENE